MTKELIRKRLERAGWKVTHDMCGMYIAHKCNRTYKADTLNGLYKQIFQSH